MATLGGLATAFETERAGKYETGLSYLKRVLDLFGADYGKGMERTAMANVNADLISRGLGSTTRPAAMSVGMKAETEDIRRSRLADALSNITQYIQQSAPTAPTVSSTAQSANVALRSPGALATTSSALSNQWRKQARNDPSYNPVTGYKHYF